MRSIDFARFLIVMASKSPAMTPKMTAAGELTPRGLGYDIASEASDLETIPLIVVTDPGQDMDDEMAMILMAHLAAEGMVRPLAVVSNLMPADKRALLARGSLDVLGLQHVPVGEGSDGGSDKHTDTFSESIKKLGLGYLPSTKDRIWPGQELLHKAMIQAFPKSITVLLISSLTDMAEYIGKNEDMFVKKVKRVVIMGGVEVFNPDDDRLIPDTAQNNSFDIGAAEFLYQKCQDLGVATTTLSRHAAYAAPVPRRIYDEMCEHTTNPIAKRLRAAQQASIEKLWQRASAVGDERQGLPARCDKEWFCNTFCKGEGSDRTGEDSIWDLVASFNMYDPMALLACVPAICDKYYDIISLEVNKVEHQVIGLSSERHGVKADMAEELQQFMVKCFNAGADAGA